MDDGAHVSGYFVWALLDSFEWDAGTKWHFGLVAVDFKTLQRAPKQSYEWYARLIAANSKIIV
jgi:beta-glucosidase